MRAIADALTLGITAALAALERQIAELVERETKPANQPEPPARPPGRKPSKPPTRKQLAARARWLPILERTRRGRAELDAAIAGADLSDLEHLPVMVTHGPAKIAPLAEHLDGDEGDEVP